MYKYREVTSMHEGCSAMCGNPSNWIGWAMDEEDSEKLLIVNKDGIIWAGAVWEECKEIADILTDPQNNDMQKCFKLGAMWKDSLTLTEDSIEELVSNHSANRLWSDSINSLRVVSRILLGHNPITLGIYDQRLLGDDLTLYWYDYKDVPPHVAMIVESFYYDFLTEMCLDDCEMVCVPNYYAEGFHAGKDLCADCGEVDLKGCEEWLHSTNRLDDNEMLIIHKDSYGVGELMGLDAVHNAIRGYMDCMDSDFATMSSDVSYTIEDVICNLKEGNYRFDIKGNLLD